MGAVLGCLGSVAAWCACSALTSCCGCVRKTVGTRITYAVMFLLTSIVAWILSSGWAEKKLQESVPSYLHFDCDPNQPSCFGTIAVYRVMLGLTLFHSFMAVCLFGVKSSQDPRAQLQNGLWGIKFLLWIGAVVGCFFINSSDIQPFQWACLVGGILFIFIQLFLLVDFAHSWSEKWVSNYQESEAKIWYIGLISSMSCMYILALCLTVVMYVYFIPGESECKINTFFITLNLLACFFISLVAISSKVQEKNPRSGLLQSGVVSAYATYLVWSALSSQSPSTNLDATYPCNRLDSESSDSSNDTALWIGMILTFISIAFSATRSASSADTQPITTSSSSSAAYQTASTPKPKSSARESDADDSADEEASGVAYNYFFFHLLYALGAMYVAEVLTGWNTIKSQADGTFNVTSTTAAMWAKIASSWVTLLLYLWSLIAPLVLKDRDFGYN